MLNSILLQAAGGQQSGWGSIIMIVALIAIFYFFMIRPQSQRQKKINEFRKGLSKGDHVMTAGGIYGRIKDIKETVVLLQIAEGVTIKIDKSMIYQSAQDIAETAGDPQNKD
ncbi:MAG: preprotein translocase subunit YajC [Bacteroidales bacterium]|nr:preprotein translocase subunit YajC [Candidatus Sodaliphilus fimicaballi]